MQDKDIVEIIKTREANDNGRRYSIHDLEDIAISMDGIEEKFCKYHNYSCIECPYGDRYGEGITWCRVVGEHIGTKEGNNNG